MSSIYIQSFQLPKNSFSGIYSYLFQKIYTNQKKLHELAYAIFKANVKHVTSGYDVLSIYEFLKDKKREIISYILNQIGYSILSSSVMLVDDQIDIIVYNPNSSTYSTAGILITLNANNVLLPRLPIVNNLTVWKNKYDAVFIVDYNGNIINDFNQTNGKYFCTNLNQGKSEIVPIKY